MEFHSGKVGPLSEESDIMCWKPNPDKVTEIGKFIKHVNNNHRLQIRTYDDLWAWSVDNYDKFWKEIWAFSNIRHSQAFSEVVDKSKCITERPQWFSGARLNYAENLLKTVGDGVAIYAVREGREEKIETRTWNELRERVALYAAAMKSVGVKRGDRVVGYLPNCCEAVEAMLATASIGAVWSSTSPDFGVVGVLERFQQIRPKLIFSVDGVLYGGKLHHHIGKIKGVVDGLPDLEKVIMIPYTGDQTFSSEIIPNSVSLSEFLDSGLLSNGCVPELKFEQLPFNHPLLILFTSGTTGVPKCVVHSAGGTLLQQFKETVIMLNITESDVSLHYSTTGWMMFNWLIGVLVSGASIVLHDGSPLVHGEKHLWDLVDNIGITTLGVSAQWLAILEQRNIRPNKTHSLQTLKLITSTGSTLKPESFDYVYQNVKKDVLLGSISGGTDIMGAFVGFSWITPVYRGELSVPALAMSVECFNKDGKPVYGEPGDLVCTKPFPNMPVFFWNDKDGEKYKKAYFEKFPGVWTQGDFCKFNKKTGGLVLLGRSDGTLNPSGVRFGSSEIYNIVETFTEVEDSLCVGQYSSDGTERVLLFLKIRSEFRLTQALVERIKHDIREKLSPRHVPSLILETQDIPYTINGKKVEVAVKQIISGLGVSVSRSALSNPDALDLYKNIPALEKAGYSKRKLASKL